jgi:transcriptional regulator with XRE-family HTH domain
MSSLYNRIAQRPDGERDLAAARLRYEVLAVIQEAFTCSTLTQVALAGKLRVRKSAVNQVLHGNGNVQITTLAEYLFEMGYELRISLVRAGTPREEELLNTPPTTASSGFFDLHDELVEGWASREGHLFIGTRSRTYT